MPVFYGFRRLILVDLGRETQLFSSQIGASSMTNAVLHPFLALVTVTLLDRG
jgi:hypothetical protein